MAISVNLLKESGFDEAMLGISLSFNAPVENMPARAEKLAMKGMGHSKFLESMMVWIDVRAPRYFWQEADTYRISSKQSQATMHTLTKKPLCQGDFAGGVPDQWIEDLNAKILAGDLFGAKRLLPESFLQRRIWCMSYKTLQNIVQQRKNHRLEEWREFCQEILKQVEHPSFLDQ